MSLSRQRPETASADDRSNLGPIHVVGKAAFPLSPSRSVVIVSLPVVFRIRVGNYLGGSPNSGQRRCSSLMTTPLCQFRGRTLRRPTRFTPANSF